MISIDEGNRTPAVSVHTFLEIAFDQMPIECLVGSDSLKNHSLDSPRVQKLGLALSGFTHRIHPGRIQIYGNSEAYFFSNLSANEISTAIDRLDAKNISCILVTASNNPPERFREFARKNKIPLLRTSIASSEAINAVARILGFELAPQQTVHGVLIEVFGIGTILIGESGIGKSECALDLIGRGHRLISDDSVVLRRIGDRLIGAAPDITRDHLEIRGLGIINARELFGVSALGRETNVALCIEFVGDSEESHFDRLGFESGSFSALGIDIHKFVFPVRPGRNLATLSETAVRVFVSNRKAGGAAHELIARHDKALRDLNGQE